jgi:hypothetical protein
MNHHERFNYNVWYPGTEKIDAFSQFMGNDMNFLVLPPILITKTLSKLRQDKAKVILIIYVWNLTRYSPIVQKKIVFSMNSFRTFTIYLRKITFLQEPVETEFC